MVHRCAVSKASKPEAVPSSAVIDTVIDLTLESSDTDQEEAKDDDDSPNKVQSSLEVMIAKLKSRVKEEKEKPISGLLVTSSHRIRQQETGGRFPKLH